MPERQITAAAKNHNLDSNDNFSPCGRFLCYDTREMLGPGIGNSQSIEMVETATGARTVIYAPERTRVSPDESQSAPGVGAVSFSPVAMEVAFIHGPPLEDVPARGHYGKPNRQGALVPADGSQRRAWLDWRDVDTGRDTLPGAHRGGTHRHEFCPDGSRIGFTYDDFLAPQFARTIGYMEPRPDAPRGASHWFALLVRPVPRAEAKPGDIVQALGDSWAGRAGAVRAFIGTVMEDDGIFTDALFTVTIPPGTDITTADAGGPDRYPGPPAGLVVRRITRSPAKGIVRGSHDGARIAYYAADAQGLDQVFVVPVDGGEDHPDPAARPVQLTRFRTGAEPGLRWSPDGRAVYCVANNGIAAVCAEPGARLGEARFLTPQGDGPQRFNLVVSPDGKTLAYNRAVPVYDRQGKRQVNYAGHDFLQIFTVETGA